MNKSQTFMKMSQNFMKNLQKFTCDGFFPQFLPKKKKYGSFQESPLVRCGRDSGCKNLKLTTWP